MCTVAQGYIEMLPTRCPRGNLGIVGIDLQRSFYQLPRLLEFFPFYAGHSQRRFIVTTPAGQKHEVLVEIDVEAVSYVERMTGRRLRPESSFWTSQARRFLSDFLWHERKVPPMRSEEHTAEL